MTVYRLPEEPIFPDPSEADPSGLLAVGGDLSPQRLLNAYALGIFPWYEEPPILWFSPDPRMVLRPAELHVSKRLERTLRSGRFRMTLDTAFGEVIRACARTPRQGQDGTWITAEMIAAYEELHALGFAHSCEAWDDDALAGGIYGVSLGDCFFGESMFHHRRDASKAAFVTLVRELDDAGVTLVDCQLHTAHLARFGAVEWRRSVFLDALAREVRAPTRRGRWTLGAIPRGAER